MKFKQFLAAALLLCTAGASAQTDVTSTYLTNADFSQGTPLTSTYLYGYGTDGTPYGFQKIPGWTSVVTATNNNYGYAGGTFAYGSSTHLKGNDKGAPATDPDGNEGNALGFFAVWGAGGYYYQDVTLPAGMYKLTFPIYCASGTQANTTYTGFFPSSGTNRTVAINTTVGEWATQTVEFTLTAETAGQIRVGYQSTGSGSGANPMLFFDGVKIEFTATVVKDVLETALSAANKANATLGTLDDAIATAQAVYDNESATQDEVNAAAATLNAAVELAMSDAGDVTDMFLTNADLSSVDGWTLSASASYHDQGSYQIGGDTNVRFAAPTADETHLTSEYAFGFECRWNTNYTSYFQTTDPVPAGVYTLTFDVENVNGSTTSATNYNNLFYLQAGSNKVTDTATEWMKGKSSWTTHTIRITVEEAAPLTVSLGYGTGSNNFGADNTPAIYVSHVKLNYQSFIAGAKAAWDEAKAAAETAVANEDYENVTGEELAALDAEIAKSEPTTAEGYNEATEALQNATNAFVAAKASYDAFYAIATSDYVTTLDYGTEDKRQALDEAAVAEPTSAADAVEKTAAVYTALRAYYESHAMAENVEGAVDMTDKVAAANADTNTGWTNGIGTNQGQGYTDAAGTTAPKYLDGGWAQNAGANIDMTRSVEIPAGKYLLTVTARGAVDLDTYTLSIGGQTIDLPHANGASGGVFGNGWDDASVEFETDGSVQTLEVIAKSTATQQWMSINRFRLVRLELYTEMATAEDYAALNAAITEAEGKALGFDEGEYAPYKNIEALQAIANAKAINQEVENAKADIEALTTALGNWTANTEEVDAIFDGQFATTEPLSESGKVVLPGWTKVNGIRLLVKDETVDPGLAYTDGKAAVFSWGGTTLTYGEQTGYTLPLNKGELYEVTLKVAGWRDGDFANVLTVTLDGDSKTVNPNVPGKINDAEGNPFASVKFYLTPTADNSTLTIYANHHFAIADLSMKLAVAEELTLDEAVAFEQAEETLANVTMKRKIVDGLNAVSLPFALDAEQVAAMFGEGAVVYAFSEEADGTNSQINFNTKAEQTIEANVPVLVKATAASTSQSVDGVIVKTAEAKVAGTNFDFVGNYNGAVTVAAGDYFVSSGKLYKSIGSTTLKGFRAFIQDKNPDVANEVKLFIDGDAIDTDLPTAIDSINANTNGEAYDLSGRKVNAPTQKGVYIIGGKKVAVK